MIQLNSYEIKLLVEECRDKVVQSYIRNIYQISPKALAFKLYKPNYEAGELWTVAAYAVFWTSKTISKPPQPSRKVLELRRYIVGKKIIGISQIEGERIVRLEIEGYVLYVECMPPGNIVLVRDERIEWLLENFEFKTRLLKRGERYIPPPPKTSAAIETTTLEHAKSSLPKLSLITFVSRELGLGGKLGEEIVHRAGLAKNAKIGELSIQETNRLAAAFSQLVDEMKSPKPRVYMRNGEALPSAVELKTINHLPNITTETFAEAVQLAYLESLEAERKKIAEKEKSAAIEKLRREKENKQYVLAGLEKDLMRLQSFVDKLVESWSFVERLLQEEPMAEDVSLENGLVAKVLEDRVLVRYAEKEITLKKNSPLSREVGKIYEELKSVRKSVEKLRNEISELDKAIESSEASLLQETVTKPVLRIIGKKTKPFREFKSSGGFKVLMGKDARTNVMLLKRHLEKEDLVLHADIPGSPTTLMKNGRSASAADVEEAAQMTASYSRAWREKFTNVSVYSVNADQISFSPPSGEYLAKGSFMVYGRKNYHVAELRLAVAFLEEGLGVVPYLTAVRKGLRAVEIRPGSTSADLAAKKILELLGIEPTPENIQTIASQIPFGTCDVLDILING
ncbi:MAG: NFACT family protein [Candidatus Caldarchaeum sp.]|nr:NFACT family protein [Candidatus Caldarchaeum sp.]